MNIVLASKSPRRKEILENLGLNFEIIVCEAEEKSDKTDVKEFVKEISLQKAQNVNEKLEDDGKFKSDTLVIGCDTVVSIGGKILGKPKDKADAFNMIKTLSGKKHSVISGLTLIYGDRILCETEETAVLFDGITDEEIENYVSLSEPYDKAGGYAVQGIASKFVKGINGCYFNVVGLPVYRLNQMAKKLGINLY